MATPGGRLVSSSATGQPDPQPVEAAENTEPAQQPAQQQAGEEEEAAAAAIPWAPETPAEEQSRRLRPEALAKRRVGTGWTATNRRKSTPIGAPALLPLHLRADGSLAPPTPPLQTDGDEPNNTTASPTPAAATSPAAQPTEEADATMVTPVVTPARRVPTPETRGERVMTNAAAGATTPALAQYWYEAGAAHSPNPQQVQEEAPATQFVTSRRRRNKGGGGKSAAQQLLGTPAQPQYWYEATVTASSPSGSSGEALGGTAATASASASASAAAAAHTTEGGGGGPMATTPAKSALKTGGKSRRRSSVGSILRPTTAEGDNVVPTALNFTPQKRVRFSLGGTTLAPPPLQPQLTEDDDAASPAATAAPAVSAGITPFHQVRARPETPTSVRAERNTYGQESASSLLVPLAANRAAGHP